MLKNLSIIILITLYAFCQSTGKFDFLKADANLTGKHWAVLIAGSNGFWNYRHQSDILHAYQILVNNGIPKEQIIVLAYDDIANDPENPFPGQIFNKPDPTGKGQNVYAGVPIDYKGANVTPEIFLAVLEGDATKLNGKGSGRFLDTTSADNVFIFFSDHGATGLIAFPSSELYANQLLDTLNKMNKANKYKELVFYLEACESGSMFNKNLPSNTRIYATTAANPTESSWAIYCQPDDVVGGKSIGTCLGDEYSVNWMEDSDSDIGLKKSLQDQFSKVKTQVKQSKVQQYGDISYKIKDIGQYQGSNEDRSKSYLFKKMKKAWKFFHKKFFGGKHKKQRKLQSKSESDHEIYLKYAKNSKVDSREAKLRYLYDKATQKNDKIYLDRLEAEVRHMKNADSIFYAFNEVFNIQDKEVDDINFECLIPSVEVYKKICQWGEYDLKYVKNIALACERNVTVDEIKETFEKICMV
jgi:legumain